MLFHNSSINTYFSFCFKSGILWLWEEAMQNNKKTVRAILQALNIVSLEQKYEYKVCYEYKFSTSLNDIVVVRKLIIFLGRSPVWSQYFNNDLEIITFLLQEMEKFENGTIHYDTKPQREKKKRGRKPKGEKENGKDCN